MNAHSTSEFGMAKPSRFFFARGPGRPCVADSNSEASRKPWIAEGISQRTYYRRKAASAARVLAEPVEPQQHMAHVLTWFEAASPFERLDYKAMARRCARAPDGRRGNIVELYIAALERA